MKEANVHFKKTLNQFAGKPLSEKPVIILDNGAYEAKAGWSFEDEPFLRFKN